MRQILDSSGMLKYNIMDTQKEILVLAANGDLVYRYIKDTDQTLDHRGQLVMRGNIVLGLK